MQLIFPRFPTYMYVITRLSTNVADGQTDKHGIDGVTDDMRSQDRASHYIASRGERSSSAKYLSNGWPI